MATLPDSLSDFIDQGDPSEKGLLVVNRTGPEPLVRLLEAAFDDQPVSVADRQIPEGVEDLVCLVDDGKVQATTPFSALEEAFLLVNVDRYRTGTNQLEGGSFPDVLTGLDEVEFTVRGFPASNKEKLLLVVISRFIEAEALECEAGELHSTFQRLSRLDDEYGTRTVYEWLAESDVETNVYGVCDDPDVVETLDVTVHAGETEEHRRSWVVAFRPPERADADAIGLVAEEIDQNVWRGLWTYDRDRVARVQAYLARNF